MACPCPAGFKPDATGLNCVGVVSIPATNTGSTYTVGVGDKNGNYCVKGAFFYQDITTLSYPITYPNFSNLDIVAANGQVLLVNNTVVNSLWGNGGIANGRLNNTGVWVNPPYTNPVEAAAYVPGFATPPFNKWIGFSACVNVPTTGTYCIGMAADNACRFKLNGTLLVELNNSGPCGAPLCGTGPCVTPGLCATTLAFIRWHVFPVTLQAGQNIIHLEGLNYQAVAAFGAEIYNATPAQLAVMTTPAQLQGVTIFSTVNKIGQSFQIGDTIGYSCPPGYALNTCLDVPSCTIAQTIPNPCCYRLTNCVTGIIVVTSSDLSASVGQVVTFSTGTPPTASLPGCWKVSGPTDCVGAVAVPAVATTSLDCPSCLPCFKLTNCLNPAITINTTVVLTPYLGQVVQIDGYPNDCWTVSATTGCTLTVPVLITTTFATCDLCTKKCYLLVDCAGKETSILVSNDLSASLGHVVKIDGCKNICWKVLIASTCVGAVPKVITATFDTCDLCNPPIIPPPPALLHQRKVKPGYNTPGCSPEYTEKVNCEFAGQIFNQVKKRRYGITTCCDDDLQKWMIKKQLLDLRAIWDQTLCVTTVPITCCTPCPVPVVPVPPVAVACYAPVAVSSVITIITPCLPDAGPVKAQIIFNTPIVIPTR